ncbi:hypothetical protein [Priestia abyssalis]|uniref:hypothetical protein n=1 Tax=Priestia abyssalis TaxID=1221450 RepID=UPI00099579C0|nr:hypothetical protein [Priestia abyssalis]
MINIKYEIFEDDVEELRIIDVLTFDKEYHQIYGLFTLTVGEHNFIPSPPDNIPLSAKRSYSELILTHFKLLNETVSLLDTNGYVALKYIENDSQWLELKVEKDLIKVSELKYEIRTSLDSFICTEEKFLRGAKYGSFKEITVLKKQFENEVKKKTRLFLEEIKSINPVLLESKFFNRIAG